jgi:hypothetical protein
VPVSQERRHRVAQLVLSRRHAAHESRELWLRFVAVVALLFGSVPSAHRGPALLLLIPAWLAIASQLGSARLHTARHGWTRVWWSAAAVLGLAVPSWVATDVTAGLRVLGFVGAVILACSVVTSWLTLPAWFDPQGPRSRWLEALRRLGGPLTMTLTGAVAWMAPWPSEARAAVWVLACVPALVTVRVWDLDHWLRNAVPLIREAGQQGRDEVLRDIHGTLSTALRQLEQRARVTRQQVPGLYELAVNANSSLRETLTLVEENRDSSTSTDTLEAPILTLTRAEGAFATTRIEAEQLTHPDREIARFVLNELVAHALRVGATRLDVALTCEAQNVIVSVLHDAGSQPSSEGLPSPGTPADLQRPASSERAELSHLLEQRLSPVGGGLTWHQHGARGIGGGVTARWVAHS